MSATPMSHRPGVARPRASRSARAALTAALVTGGAIGFGATALPAQMRPPVSRANADCETARPAILAAAPDAGGPRPAVAPSTAGRVAGDAVASDTGQRVRLSLGDVLAAARRCAPSVEGAEARAAEARARVGEARGALLPQLGATAGTVTRSFNRQSLGIQFPVPPGGQQVPDLVGPFANQDARVGARLLLFDASAWGRLRTARAGSDVAAAEATAAADNAAFAAANAYVALARAEATVRARATDTTLALQLLGIARNQRAAGATAGIDVTRAQVQLAAARTAHAQAVGTADRARFELLRAIAAPQDQAVATDPLDLVPLGLPEAPDTLVALALRTRPEFEAERARIHTAARARAAVRAEGLPTIALAGDYGVNGNVSDGRTEGTQTLGLQLAWSPWDGGRRTARVAQQTAQLRAAEARERDLRAAIEAETRSAAAALRTGRQAVATARERAALADTELRQSEARYRAGLAGSLDVISAQQGVVRAADALIDALAGYNAAWVAVRRATGRLDDGAAP